MGRTFKRGGTFKKVTKDNPGKRLKVLKAVTVKEAISVNNKKVLVYTDGGTFNISEDLEKLLNFKGIKYTEGHRKNVCEKLKRKIVKTDGKRIMNLKEFVY